MIFKYIVFQKRKGDKQRHTKHTRQEDGNTAVVRLVTNVLY